MKKIGISSCFMYPDLNRSTFGPKTLCYLENDMANYLYQDNIIPILIPDLKKEKLNTLLENLDGLILQGGSDVCPEKYNKPFVNKKKWPGDPYRDDYELNLIDHFYKKKKPILGICRGAQIINTYFGGSLNQDIPSFYDTKTIHRDALKYDHIFHQVTLKDDKDNVLQEIYNKKMITVNSIHHQSIEKLGDQLIVEANSTTDNIIEAFSYKNKKENLILGVQWHPEFSSTLKETVITPYPIIKYFIKRLYHGH